MILFLAPVLIFAVACFRLSGYGLRCRRLTFLACFSCGPLVRCDGDWSKRKHTSDKATSQQSSTVLGSLSSL
jgi:hypothetical protein